MLTKEEVRQKKHLWYLKNKERYNKKSKEYYQKAKRKVIKKYGGKCEICKTIENLTIDHVFGGGTKERETTTYSKTIYFYLIKNNFPKDRFRLLCLKCNINEYWKERRKHRPGPKKKSLTV